MHLQLQLQRTPHAARSVSVCACLRVSYAYAHADSFTDGSTNECAYGGTYGCADRPQYLRLHRSAPTHAPTAAAAALRHQCAHACTDSRAHSCADTPNNVPTHCMHLQRTPHAARSSRAPCSPLAFSVLVLEHVLRSLLVTLSDTARLCAVLVCTLCYCTWLRSEQHGQQLEQGTVSRSLVPALTRDSWQPPRAKPPPCLAWQAEL